MSLIFQQGASSSSPGLVSSLVARWSFHRQLVGVSPWIGTSVRIEESAANHSHPGWTISQYMHRPPSLHSQYNTPSSSEYREPWPGGGGQPGQGGRTARVCQGCLVQQHSLLRDGGVACGQTIAHYTTLHKSVESKLHYTRTPRSAGTFASFNSGFHSTVATMACSSSTQAWAQSENECRHKQNKPHNI